MHATSHIDELPGGTAEESVPPIGWCWCSVDHVSNVSSASPVLNCGGSADPVSAIANNAMASGFYPRSKIFKRAAFEIFFE